MKTREEALSLICAAASGARSTEEVPLARALGRTLAVPVIARRDIPPFHRAAMDGYALRAADLPGDGRELALAGEIFAGDDGAARVAGPGRCLKIMTGSPLPAGADAVVPVEETLPGSAGRIRFSRRAEPWQHVARQGEDARAGALQLAPGTLLTPQAVALAAGNGQDRLTVGRRPRVALLQTGNEIRPPGETIRGHEIYNSNGILLALLLEKDRNPAALDLGLVPDVPERLRQAMIAGLEHDLLLISGGVSLGEKDFVPGILRELGVEILVHGVAVKPGKPLLFGTRRRDPGGVRGDSSPAFVFGLPGNPVAHLVAFYEMVLPFLRSFEGRRDREIFSCLGRLTTPIREKPGRTYFALARIAFRAGKWEAEPIFAHGSGDYVSAAAANGVIVRPADRPNPQPGDEVTLHLWEGPA